MQVVDPVTTSRFGLEYRSGRRSREDDLSQAAPFGHHSGLSLTGYRALAGSLLLASVTGAVCALRPLKAVDLHVYYAAARSYFILAGPMYGPNSEFGWPMLYRYPPLFLCLFRPLAALPLSAVAGIWAALEVFVLVFLVFAWYRRYPSARCGRAAWLSGLLLLPYILHDIQLGNVQLFLVEMVCFALLLSGKRPVTSGALLGLATAIKVWPGFIVPFLVARRRWREGLLTVTFSGMFTIIPGFRLGMQNLFHLLEQWYFQEKQINALLGERWYPSQSLRGVMLRYLTQMDYSGLPDQNYRHVNFLRFPSWEVRQFWLLLAIALGIMALYWAYKSRSDRAAYSIFFCFLLIIQPNVGGAIYVALLWPALYAGTILTDKKAPSFARWLLIGAAAVAVVKPLIPGASAQRLAQVLGIDFFGVLMPLTFALLTDSWWGRLSSSLRS